jgi:hypothetical protein
MPPSQTVWRYGRAGRNLFRTPSRERHHAGVRVRLATLVAVAAAVAVTVTFATAQSRADGLPSYTSGYAKWPRLNANPIRGGSPAHAGRKNVYASKRRKGATFPDATVVVKTIVSPGAKYVGQVAVMRKTKGRWQFVEYRRPSPAARYTVLAGGQLCVSCHVQAKRSDYVFTTR